MTYTKSMFFALVGVLLVVLGSTAFSVKAQYILTPIEITEKEAPIRWIDSDGDGLSDFQERYFWTDPRNPDTDWGGVNDGQEVLKDKTNPLNGEDDKSEITSDGGGYALPVNLRPNPSTLKDVCPDLNWNGIADDDQSGNNADNQCLRVAPRVCSVSVFDAANRYHPIMAEMLCSNASDFRAVSNWRITQ